MDTGPTTPRWRTGEYAEQLRAWVEGELGPVRMTQKKLRAWATVWRIEAGTGVYWAKQNCPSQAFEGPLTALLAELVPDRVLEPVATTDDGILLLPDGGPVLRDVDGGSHDLAAWCRVVGEWAELQRSLLDRTDEISAVGVDTMTADAAVGWVRERAELLHALDPADPRRLDDDQWQALRASEPAIAEAAATLVDLGLPLALNHNDLHDGNAFAVADGRPLRFFDLADAVLTNPMAVLLVPLGQLPDDPRVRGTVTRAWVEVWREVTDEAALWRVLPHALRLAALSRHQAWWRVMRSMTEEELAEWGVAAPYWLARASTSPPDLVALA
jgi:hypothetical protein